MECNDKRKLLPTGATPKKAEKFRKQDESFTEDGVTSSLRSPLSSSRSREGKRLIASPSPSPKGVKVS